MDEAWIALIGTVFGGAGFKVIEHILGRASQRDSTATSIRTELRLDNSDLRVENAHLHAEVDEWRDKYYALLADKSER
jgi:hypothetical protein